MGRHAQQHDAGDLRHGLQLEHAGHDRMAGEVFLEEWLVDGDVFDPGALGFTVEADDAIHQEERIAVRAGSSSTR